MVLQHFDVLLVILQSHVCTGSEIGTAGFGGVKVPSCFRVLQRQPPTDQQLAHYGIPFSPSMRYHALNSRAHVMLTSSALWVNESVKQSTQSGVSKKQAAMTVPRVGRPPRTTSRAYLSISLPNPCSLVSANAQCHESGVGRWPSGLVPRLYLSFSSIHPILGHPYPEYI